MGISGIYIRIDPLHWASATDALRELPGLDLHHGDASTGRLVVTQDAESTKSQKSGVEIIRQIPGVVMAEPVYYYPDDEEEDDGT